MSSNRDDEFLASLRATFAEEAEEHVQSIATGLLALEQQPQPQHRRSVIEQVFRAAHSLKGAARAVEFRDVELHCQVMEDMFATWQRQEGRIPAAGLNAMHATLNLVTAALSPAESAARPPATSIPHAAPVAVTTRQWEKGETSVPAALVRPEEAEPARKAFSAEGTVRISVAKLESQLMKAEEMLTAKLSNGRRVEELRELALHAAAWRAPWATAEPIARALRQRRAPVPDDPVGQTAETGVDRLLEFLDWSVEHLKSVESKVAALTTTAGRNHYVVGKLVDDLLDDSKQLLVLPFGTLAAQFPKLVRDLLHDQGKKGTLVMRGEEIEIDKRILEDMKDPLIHILRNCVDHGIEAPERRVGSGKPDAATIMITVSQLDGSRVEILVTDDGAGIDVKKIRASAVQHGMPASDVDQLGDDLARDLIFQPNVTTAPIITRLSGRGLGMAIVRERVEKLGGFVTVESEPGVGTRFRIVVPTVLATFRGIAVRASDRTFIVPTANTDRVARVARRDVQTVEGRETVVLNGRTLSLAWLADVLELPRPAEAENGAAVIQLVVLGTGDHRIAFVVDDVLDEQEVLVKRMRRPLTRVKHVSGVTVLGTGQLVPILHVADLLRSGSRAGGPAPRTSAPSAPAIARDAAVLVAEDSITSRMLIKGILESAGYRVTTAVDGLEALTLLRAEHFDLLVTDAEMPRMNGFDLTARIRADAKLAELPVILVTALESRDDRERGIDVGANAYIVKSSFAQSDLLDAVRRLL